MPKSKPSENARMVGAKLADVMYKAMEEAIALLATIATAKYMRFTTKSRVANLRPHPTILTIRSGRLARSLIEENNPETLQPRVTIEGTKLIGRLGSRVPYAARHEFGGTYPVTAKQRRFFWHKFYESEDSMWKRMALSKTIKTPPRPYLRPSFADKDARDAIAKIFISRAQQFFDRGEA